MRPTCGGSWCNRTAIRVAVAVGFAPLGLCGCGQAEGIVGRQHVGSTETTANIFASEFLANDGLWSVETALARASVSFGQPDASARDGNMAALVFPGNAALGVADDVGPDYVTQLATNGRFGFGTLRTRVNFGACSGAEEVVQAVLGYFSDGEDHNGNGLTDDVEIDLQIVCGTPTLAYLSVYTDYQATASGEQYRKLSHIVDFSTGTEYDTPADNSDAFVASGTRTSLARPRLVAANTYYELGYERHKTSIRFFLNDGNEELTLWTLADAAHVPDVPVYLMYNLWHPSSHWFPASGDADFPANDVVMKVDWIRFEPSAE
jgi:hypothetical protein